MTLKEFVRLAQSAAAKPLCPLVLVCALGAQADQVEMSNGDRYVGRVLSLSNDTLLLQSEVLGALRLPRARISTISLEPRAAGFTGFTTNVARPAPLVLRSNSATRVSAAISTNAAAEFSAAMRQLGTNSKTVQQVQDQLLTGAGPEAQAKFNDLVGGLMSGKVDLNQLRAEAKSTMDQAKRARGDMGEEGGGMLDSYLAILDSFLKETEPAVAPTNTPASQPTIPALRQSE
jgi:hypothetical protein